MDNHAEICTKCLGEGEIIKRSRALSSKLTKRKCNICNGLGEVPAIMNSAFLNSEQIFID